jgi:pyridoxine kinase
LICQKRALAVHDISCVGKCSLTVALPIISAAGIEVAVLPTAVLSTHTGGFTGYTFRDLTGDLIPIAEHWERLGITFDAIYTGYLGSYSQIGLIKELIGRFGKNALVLVDPVMAENGRLYSGFDAGFPSGMAELCKMADIVVPNLTEAALMLNEPYADGPFTEDYINGLVRRLGKAFGGKVVLTGVSFDKTRLGAAYYDSVSGELGYAMNTRIEGFFHGTGDIFGSVLLSGFLNGLSFKDTVQTAVDFTVDSIKLTESGREQRYGVRFEAALPGLIKKLGM